MKLFMICTLFILFSCAPTTQKTQVKTQKPSEKIKAHEPVNISKLDSIIVLLDKNTNYQRLFFKEFTDSDLVTKIDEKINFYYSTDDLNNIEINNTIIIGPNNSSDLLALKEKIGKNNLILSLTNDLSLKKKFGNDQIVFLGMSPFLHILKLKNSLSKSTSIAVLYRQNFYGVRLNNYFKENFKGKYVKSAPYSNEPQEINFAIQSLGDLIQYDNIILIDDTMSYKDILTNLSSKNNIYPYEKIYLIDNFLEHRSSISSFYKQIKRANISNINIEKTNESHREFFYRSSINMAIAISHEIIKTNNFSKIVFSDELGYLEVKDSVVNYAIDFR